MESLTKLVTLTLPQFAALVALFLPGFVSLRVDRLIQPGQVRSAADLIVDVLAYSLVNGALMGWALWLAASEFRAASPDALRVWGLGLIICLAGPTTWPILFRLAQRFGADRGWLVGPDRFAWDHFFRRHEPSWVILRLKSGKLVGGYFGSDSYASVEPESGHIYLQQLWKLDRNGRFVESVVDSKGALFRPTDYDWIEFYHDRHAET